MLNDNYTANGNYWQDAIVFDDAIG